MRYVLLSFCCSCFIMSCSNISFKEKEYIEVKLIGLVFCNYYIDSIEKMSHFSPYPYIEIYISNKTSDTIVLSQNLNAKFNYFYVPLQQSIELIFPCHKLCQPLAPHRKRYQELLNLEYAFWMESEVGVVYNDSLAYKNRCKDLYSNTLLNVELLGHSYQYRIKSTDILYVQDCSIAPGFETKYMKMRHEMYKNSRFPIERIYVR